MLGMRQTLASAALGATSGPRAVLSSQLLLIAGLGATVALSGAGLSPAGWAVGVSCGVITNAALTFGRSNYRADRLTRADWVTLARAADAFGVAALVADSFGQPVPVATLVSLSALALALDALDGWVARHTRTGKLGAKFDGEVDAFLMLVLSVYVARSAGAWVLAIGAARYLFLAAGWPLPWMREPLPPRYWRKLVAATQGIVPTVAAELGLPAVVPDAGLAAALGLLTESFGRDVLWLRRHRRTIGPERSRGRVRTVIAAALTILAAVFVWAALVAPNQPIHVTPSAFLRVPLEGLALVALAAVLPATARRRVAWVGGPVLGLGVILKVLDIGFFATFDRPFDPYQDASYAGIGSETLRSSIGAATANLVIAGVVALVVALLVLSTLAVRRLTRVAAHNRRWSLRAVAALGVVWLVSWAFG